MVWPDQPYHNSKEKPRNCPAEQLAAGRRGIGSRAKAALEELHVVLDAVPDLGQGVFQGLRNFVVGALSLGRDDDFPAALGREGELRVAWLVAASAAPLTDQTGRLLVRQAALGKLIGKQPLLTSVFELRQLIRGPGGDLAAFDSLLNVLGQSQTAPGPG